MVRMGVWGWTWWKDEARGSGIEETRNRGSVNRAVDGFAR
jgi:hypothetical protein